MDLLLNKSDNFITVNVVNKDNNKILPPTNLYKAKMLVKRNKAKWLIKGKIIKLLQTQKEFKQLKKQIIEEEKRICYICNEYIPEKFSATIDHVNPKTKLGQDVRENMRCCCKRCNDDKSSMNIAQYYYHVRRNKEKYPYLDIKHLKRLKNKYITV